MMVLQQHGGGWAKGVVRADLEFGAKHDIVWIVMVLGVDIGSDLG